MKRIVLSILLILPILVIGQTGTFKLKGHISEWKGKTLVYLEYYVYTEKTNVKDSTLSTNGYFEFTGKIAQPVGAYVYIKNNTGNGINDDGKSVFLETGNISIEGSNSLSHTIVKGSKVNDDQEKLGSQTQPLMARIMAINQKSGQTSEVESKAMEKEANLLVDSLDQVNVTFIKTNPGSFVSLATMDMITGISFDYQKFAPLFNQLDASLRNTPMGKDMERKLAIAKTTMIGAAAPVFTSSDTARNSLRLTDVLKKGKLTMIDFWASWCGPCRAENPNVVKVYNAFHDKGFNIISVSLDENLTSWKKAILKDGMPWYHVSGLKNWNEPVAVLYGIHAVPDNFLLDENGKIIARGLRGGDLYKKIESLLQAATN